MANIITPEARIAFPVLFTPEKYDESSKAKYGASLLFAEGANLSALERAVDEAISAKWGQRTPKKVRMPFLEQGDFDTEGFVPGAIFIRVTSNQRPGLVGPDLQPILLESDIYGGCYVRASVRPFTYEAKGNVGVAFGLQNIQKLREGETIFGRIKPEAEFEPITVDGFGDADIFA